MASSERAGLQLTLYADEQGIILFTLLAPNFLPGCRLESHVKVGSRLNSMKRQRCCAAAHLSQLRQPCVRSVARLTAAAGAHSAPQGAEACWRHHRHREDRRVCWGPLARSLHGCAALLPVVRTSLHNDVLAGTELVASVVRTLRLNPSPCRRAARHRCPRPAWCCGRCRCDWRGGGSPEHCAQLGAHPHPAPRYAPSAAWLCA